MGVRMVLVTCNYPAKQSLADTFSMASRYCSTYLPTSPANFFVKGWESAPGASGMIEPYPKPVDQNSQSLWSQDTMPVPCYTRKMHQT